MVEPLNALPTRPPRISGLPLLGPVVPLLRDRLSFLTTAHRLYGDVVHFPVGPPPARQQLYGVFGPRGASDVLSATASDHFRKDSALYDEMRTILGNGLLSSIGPTWQRQKRFVQPLFTSKRVDRYVSSMAQEIESFIDCWRPFAARTIDLGEEMTGLTVPLVSRILFGNDATTMVPVVRGSSAVLGNAIVKRGFNPIKTPLSLPTPLNVRARRAQRRVHSLVDGITVRRHSAVEQDDLLGRLIAARDGDESLSDDEVRDQVLIFLFAGQETTATALTFAFYLLGLNPEVQCRVLEEAGSVLNSSVPTAADVRKLEFTTMVVKEAMRLYPPVPLIGRSSAFGETVDGYYVPPGAHVLVAPWVVHRRPDLWPNPLVFDPERFAAGTELPHTYAWLPFGHGPRGCVGHHFAMLEMVLAVAMLVRDFEFFSSDEKVEVTADIVLRTKNPIRSRVTRRGHSGRME